MRPVPSSVFVVDVAALRRKGEARHHVEAELGVDLLRTPLADTDAEVASPGRVTLDLHLQGDGSLVVTGDLTFAFTVPCARCLEPAAVDGSSPLAALVVRDGASKLAEISGDDDDESLGDDIWTYDGSALELLPMITEQVKLAYPMRALCARGEACRGLCSSCGAPLDEQAADAAACERCGTKDPRVPEVDDIPAPGAGAENPLAAALRKLQSGQ